MMTLLPREQVDMLRSVGESANVLWALILIDRLHPGHSTTSQELKNILGSDKRTIEKRLDSLCVTNRAVFDGHGYVLLEGGRALLLAAAPSLPNPISKLENGSLDWDAVEALAPTSPQPSDAAQSDGPQSHPQSRQEISEAPIEAQALDIDLDDAQNVQEGEEITVHTMRALLEEEDINKESLIKDSSSIDSRSAQSVPTQPTTLQILDATELLFDKTMTTGGIADKPRRLAIGWVAQAWDQRKFLRSPQGLIYSKLNKGEMPQAKYYEHPRTFLPESYLVAIGLMAPRQAEELVIAEPESDPETLDDLPVDQAAVDAWGKVLNYLQGEMHRAPFDAWVRDTRGIRFERNTLVVGTKSATGCEWLESRVRATAERLLVGILARSVAVEFVVSSGE